MECSACGSNTSINFGGSSAVLCKSCDYKGEDSHVQTNVAARTALIIKSKYSTATGVSTILEYGGWLFVVAGVIISFVGLNSVIQYANGVQHLFSMGPGVGIAISGLFMVAAAQVTKAVVDTADNSRKILSLMEKITAVTPENEQE